MKAHRTSEESKRVKCAITENSTEGAKHSVQERTRNVAERLTIPREEMRWRKVKKGDGIINAGDGHGPLSDCCNVSQ